jgi:NAD(P)-dependent dehydrogenase (short-subunit alcohol dehydrogenase family)
MMKRFDNRTVIITGGVRGMGASHVRGFIAEDFAAARTRPSKTSVRHEHFSISDRMN